MELKPPVRLDTDAFKVALIVSEFMRLRWDQSIQVEVSYKEKHEAIKVCVQTDDTHIDWICRSGPEGVQLISKMVGQRRRKSA